MNASSFIKMQHIRLDAECLLSMTPPLELFAAYIFSLTISILQSLPAGAASLPFPAILYTG